MISFPGLASAAASFQLQSSLAALQRLDVFELVHDFRVACSKQKPNVFCQLRCSVLTGAVIHVFLDSDSPAPPNSELLLSCRNLPPDPSACTWILHPAGSHLANQDSRETVPVDSLSKKQLADYRKRGWERVHLCPMPPSGWVPLRDDDPDVTSIADSIAKISSHLRSHILSLEQNCPFLI